MATARNILKTYFETGKYPTEAQFAELIDALRHADDPIPMTDIQGLADALNGKAGTEYATALDALLLRIGNGELGMTDGEREMLLTSAQKAWINSQMADALAEEAKSKFSVSTATSGTSSYSVDALASATMTVTVTTKFDGVAVDCDSTPSGWTRTGTGIYARSVTSTDGSSASVSAATFTYTPQSGTYQDLTVSKPSAAKSIAVTTPFYYGWADSALTATGVATAIAGLTRKDANTGSGTFSTAPSGTKKFWIVVPSGRTATGKQLGNSIMAAAVTSGGFASPQNPAITLTGYNVYISTNEFDTAASIVWGVS
mgnify:CR=1 FL=1